MSSLRKSNSSARRTKRNKNLSRKFRVRPALTVEMETHLVEGSKFVEEAMKQELEIQKADAEL